MLARAARAKRSSGRATQATPAAPRHSLAPARKESEIAAPEPRWNFANLSISAPGNLSSVGQPRVPSPTGGNPAAGEGNERLEREADQAARQVMRMAGPTADEAGKSMGLPEVRKATTELGPAGNGSGRGVAGITSPVVRDVLGSAGRPLDAATREFFEPRFGCSFNRVRIHADERAAESAKTMRAEAYTVGEDIVLGASKDRPGTSEGRLLLAHELAHVVQQSTVQSSTENASGVSAVKKGGVLHSLTATPQHLQRKKDNWAGSFVEKEYYPISEPKLDPPGYGAHITISFEPSEKVDASAIAFVQTVQMLITDSPGDVPQVHKPFYVKDAKDEKSLKDRSLSGDDDVLGTHIDQPTQQRTPLYSATGASEADIKSQKKTASPLAASTPARFSDFGHRKKDEKKGKAAIMTDQPGLSASKEASAFGKFETTALAIEGAQQGTYYGTVKWGFTKDYGETAAKVVPFELSPSSAPSPTFFEAAKRFGVSQTSAGEESLALPISENRFVKVDTTLRSEPDKGKVAALTINTPVEILDDATRKGWVKVIVTGGDHLPAMGWLKDSELAATTQIIPKKRQQQR